MSGWLAREGLARSISEIALLLITELVTNSVRHASTTEGDHLHLRGSSADSTLRFELDDRGTEGTVARRERRRDDGEAGGYGLQLVESLASAWGVDRGAHGTTVWLELATRTAD